MLVIYSSIYSWGCGAPELSPGSLLLQSCRDEQALLQFSGCGCALNPRIQYFSTPGDHFQELHPAFWGGSAGSRGNGGCGRRAKHAARGCCWPFSGLMHCHLTPDLLQILFLVIFLTSPCSGAACNGVLPFLRVDAAAGQGVTTLLWAPWSRS